MPDHVRLGFLLINSNAMVQEPGNTDHTITAEEYFRKSEGKDHSGWDDHNWDRPSWERTNYTRYLFKEIANKFNTESKSDSSLPLDRRMGRLAGMLLLGKHGFGFGGHSSAPDIPGSGNHGNSSGTGEGKNKTSTVSFSVAQVHQDGKLELDVIVNLHQGESVKITPKVRSGNSLLAASDWKNEISSKVPWQIDSLTIADGLVQQVNDDGIVFSATKDALDSRCILSLATDDPDLKFTIEGQKV